MVTTLLYASWLNNFEVKHTTTCSGVHESRLTDFTKVENKLIYSKCYVII